MALQGLDVLFGIDRAGLVGEDGPTHAGSFDLTYLRCIPNMLVMTPSDENETRQLLYTGYIHNGPAAVRYPRGTGPGVAIEQAMTALPIGKGLIRRKGHQVAILNFGTLLPAAMEAAEKLDATVVDMRFVKPLDKELITRLATQHTLLVTLEENTTQGGAGAAVSEHLACMGFLVQVMHLGLPDIFLEHGSHQQQLTAAGLDAAGVLRSIQQRLQQKDNNLSDTAY